MGTADLRPRSPSDCATGCGSPARPACRSPSARRRWGLGRRPGEADIAERTAAREFGVPLKWVENESRDTRENALASASPFQRSGVTRIVLVTHGWHMRRAVGHFEATAAGQIQIVPAPVGMAAVASGRVLDWLPTPDGLPASISSCAGGSQCSSPALKDEPSPAAVAVGGRRRATGSEIRRMLGRAPRALNCATLDAWFQAVRR